MRTLGTSQPRPLSVPRIPSSPRQSSRWIDNGVKIRRLALRNPNNNSRRVDFSDEETLGCPNGSQHVEHGWS